MHRVSSDNCSQVRRNLTPRSMSVHLTAMGVDTCHHIAGRYCIFIIRIFGIHLPVIYGERKQSPLGQLLQDPGLGWKAIRA